MTSGSRGFAGLLRAYRVAARLTQEELAARAGLGVRTISDLERGVALAPQRNTVRLLADGLGLTEDLRDAFESAARADVHGLGTSMGVSGTPIEPSAPPLVGRSAEIKALVDHLVSPGPPILVLSGAPGMGKTRLLTEAASIATRQGWAILRGGCQRRDNQEPFAPVSAAIGARLRSIPPGAAVLRGCEWLARLFPELRDVIGDALPDWDLGAEQERRLVVTSVISLIENLGREASSPAGVLLVLDDLQWAASDALELMSAIASPVVRGLPFEPQAARVRIIGAYRDNEVGGTDALAAALGDWAHAGIAVHRSLMPLTYDEGAGLFDRILSGAGSELLAGVPQRRERLIERTAGVPFLVVTFARALVAGELTDDEGAVPWSAAQGIRQRLSSLPGAHGEIVASAAVLGREVRLPLLVAVSGQAEDRVVEALEAASRTGLLVDTGEAYVFSHDVVREVVESTTGSERRRMIHRRAMTALEAQDSGDGEHSAQIAYHAVRGEAWDTAYRWLVRSGEQATSAGAVRAALRYYDDALDLCSRLATSAREREATAAEKRGFLCYAIGDFAAARADFERMRRATRGRDAHREAQALAYTGLAAFYEHQFEDGESALLAAIAAAREGFDDVRLFASIQLNSLYMVTGRHADADRLLADIADLVERVDDDLSRGWWAVTGSEVLHWSGRYDEAIALIDRWDSSVRASRQHAVLLFNLWESAIAHGGKGDYVSALALLDEVIAASTATDENFLRARALNTSGWIHYELQDFEGALALNNESLRLSESTAADIEIASNARLNLADVCLATGRLDEARAHLAVVERIVRTPRPEDRFMLWRYSQHWCHTAGELALASGALGEALALADECLERAEATRSPRNVIKALRLKAQALMTRGDFEDAAVAFDRALNAARTLANPPQLWRTLAAIGELALARGHHAEASQAFEEAVSVVEKVGAALGSHPLGRTLLRSPKVAALRAGAVTGRL